MLTPRIGVGVLIFRDGKLLLGRRKGSHGADSWSAPGGHLEFGESIEQCAQREVQEETGLRLDKLRIGPFTNDIFANEQKHYVTLFAVAHQPVGEPVLCEPEKCGGWQWFALDALPHPLFIPLQNLLQQHGGDCLTRLSQQTD
ncbi:nucleotide triphosphate diphosphatase NUDT15 [Winslowiella iniecta]|uniref:DNA mismatch repair protein MutT n=1 Tax=Winslowiella iniecta TaxID=1560201 RepID=A0A0L7T1X8_9GAMM|nr:NUDIX hydrolase [Winslowiella iniecta]KOC89305.1 DNA mismatch repair protein MutT [Winslowiella iniecta]KOC95357.1 DNA mismatch repair protein MutT [Winslowiella iniecta]